MMEIGTSTHAIAGFEPPGKPFRQALREIAECGFSHLMLLSNESGPPLGADEDAPEALIDARNSAPAAITRAVARHGLRVSSIYPGCRIDYSAAGIQETIESLLAYRELAWNIGCHAMVLPAGRAPRRMAPLREKRELLLNLARAMDAVASDDPGSVFKVAVDLHFNSLVETAGDCAFLLRQARCRNAGLCLNTGHLTTLRQDGPAILKRHCRRIHAIAWKDHLRDGFGGRPVASRELGKGDTPFKKYAAALRDCGSGFRPIHMITFEQVPLPRKKAALRRSREFLLQILGA